MCAWLAASVGCMTQLPAMALIKTCYLGIHLLAFANKAFWLRGCACCNALREWRGLLRGLSIDCCAPRDFPSR